MEVFVSAPTSREDGGGPVGAGLDAQDALQVARSSSEQESESDQDSAEDEVEDDDEETELKHAARAGIRLLEENAQLQEELCHLQEERARVEAEKAELLRLIAEKDVREAELADHLRTCIRENQGALSELHQAKERIVELQTQVSRRSSRSPGKRRGRRSSPRLKLALQLEDLPGSMPPSTAAEDFPSSGESSPTHSGGSPTRQETSTFALGAASTGRRNSMPTLQETRATDEEVKFEEAHRRNSVLGRELASAQKQIGELKPLQTQLLEAEMELQLLRAKTEDQARELIVSAEEREEERELIQSLRHTIEIYQTLDDPLAAKQDEKRSPNGREFEEELPVTPRSPRRVIERQRRRSDGYILPLSQPLPASFPSPVVDNCFSLRDENDRLLAELDHLGQQVLNLKLLEGFSRVGRSPQKAGSPQPVVSAFESFFGVEASSAGAVGPVGYGTSSRMRFLEQQVSVLQDLLRRFRVQWKSECASRRSAEHEKADLLQRMETMQTLLRRQCAACEKEREDLMAEGDDSAWDNSAAVYETLLNQTASCQSKEEEAEAEHICFSILRRLVDSWTTDKAKRMCLHDWLTNAIRGTGKRRPLYLYDLSGEIASGFQVLLVPILREKFGVQVQVEKRLRNVIVTDLKLQVTGADAAKAKACLQRISRSLLWLIDVESALMEDQDWVGEFARRKAAKMCANI
ncbi:hypothetical protein BBJ28_00023594 [Nothophytophthora sp. Chile5]|nr:hypothetical protein BBJ28_00023594 [Nothophytophthora sp. Chile5]